MPELPEVESVKLQLQKFLIGETIKSVDINYEKCFEGDSEKIKGGKIKAVRRFGKVLSIDLDNGYSLVIHIKLTGQLVYRGEKLKKSGPLSPKISGGLDGPHTHVLFNLSSGGKLYYNDVRKFGWIKVIETKDVENIAFIKKLGPELLTDKTNSPQEKLTLEKFAEILGSTRKSIKTLLLDQSKIGGVGNIYAIDGLWLAKIHPEKKANELTFQETKVLYESLEEVLSRGLKAGGASELAFVRPDGSEGDYQKIFLAYGKGGKPCPRPACRQAGAKFEWKRIGGRGTVFCPACQKK